MATQAPAVDGSGFYAAAREQGKCAVTGATGWDWDPHHVVYEKHLASMGQPPFDLRNALRVSRQAHRRHHDRFRKIRTVELRDHNINFAADVMGTERGVQYLRRYYDDTTRPDPRLELLCPAM